MDSFEDTFAVTALAFCVPVIVTMWVFEAPAFLLFRRADLAGGWYLPTWLDDLRQILGVAWTLWATARGVSRIHKLALGPALGVTTLGAIPAYAVMLTYLR